MELDFISVPALKKMKRLVKKRSEREQQPKRLPTAGEDENGRKQYKIPDAPDEQPDVVGDNKDRKKKVG